MTTYATSPASRFVAILLMRCPRCCKGGIYHGFLRTRERCLVCGLKFEREPGYFVGAMYASYTFGILLTTPIWLALLLTGQDYGVILVASFLPLIIMMPLFFHYSRVLWLHWDYHFNPGTFVD